MSIAQPCPPTHPPGTSENLTAALQIAARRWPVLPLCWPSPDGTCGANHADCRTTPRNIGKTPLTLSGFKDASTDADQVASWWRRWPNANVGVDLERAGLLMLDPDSDAAQAEAIRLGIPPTMTRASHNGAYLYARPEGCPKTSRTQLGTSKKIDIKANGYAVVFGTHRFGDAIYVDGEDPTPAPAWTVQLLQESATRKAAYRAEAIPGEGVDREPPVRLDGTALELWYGRGAPTNDGGRVDRSRALFFMGRNLALAGASHYTIVNALEERDETLGWRKYTGRNQPQRYSEIAGSSIEYAAAPRLEPQSHPHADHCCAQLRDRIALQDRIIVNQGELIHQQAVYIRKYGGKWGIAFDMAAECASAARRQVDPEQTPAYQEAGLEYSHVGQAIAVFGADPGDEKAVNTVAQRVGRGCKHWIEAGAFREIETPRTPKPIKTRDPITGEIRERIVPVKEQRIVLDVPTRRPDEPPDLIDFLYWANGEYAQSQTETRGGKREPRRCPLHPNADMLRKTTVTCADCADAGETRVLQVTGPTRHVRLDRRPDFPRPWDDYTPKNFDPSKMSAEDYYGYDPLTVTGPIRDVFDSSNETPAIAPAGAIKFDSSTEIDWRHPERHFASGSVS